MEKLSVGSIVFVHFPFSNLQESKLRPAVIIAEVSNDDWVLCQITSRSYADITSIEITDKNFQQGRLNITSYIRPGKIFTGHESIIDKCVGRLNRMTQQQLIDKIIALIDIK